MREQRSDLHLYYIFLLCKTLPITRMCFLLWLCTNVVTVNRICHCTNHASQRTEKVLSANDLPSLRRTAQTYFLILSRSSGGEENSSKTMNDETSCLLGELVSTKTGYIQRTTVATNTVGDWQKSDLLVKRISFYTWVIEVSRVIAGASVSSRKYYTIRVAHTIRLHKLQWQQTTDRTIDKVQSCRPVLRIAITSSC